MPITAPPPAPSTLDPINFAEMMDAFLAWMKTFGDALISEASLFLAGITGTSTTSLTIGTGTKNLVTQTGKGFSFGMEVIIAFTTDPANRMIGTVVDYDDTTGDLEVLVTAITGAGTEALWTISPTSIADFDGATFTSLVLAGMVTETPYNLTGTVIDPANGVWQYATLSGNITFTESLSPGQSVHLEIVKGAHSITWPTMDWLYADPTLSAGTTVNYIELWKRHDGTLVGVFSGPGQ